MSLLPDRHGVFSERRTLRVAAPAAATWSCVADLGGRPGWYAANRLWQLRGLLDRLLGGPGMRGRPDRDLRAGDPVDGWRVLDVQQGRSLTLVSEFRLPGRARLTHEVTTDPDDPASSVLEQRLQWHPDGWRGRVLWWAELPAHVLVMRAMVRGLAAAAERRAVAARRAATAEVPA